VPLCPRTSRPRRQRCTRGPVNDYLAAATPNGWAAFTSPRPARRRDNPRSGRPGSARTPITPTSPTAQQRVRLRLPARQHEVPDRGLRAAAASLPIVDEVIPSSSTKRVPLIISGRRESTDKYYRIKPDHPSCARRSHRRQGAGREVHHGDYTIARSIRPRHSPKRACSSSRNFLKIG